MGTWGMGLFDGDGPLDAIGDLTEILEEQVTKLAELKRPSADSAGRLSGAVGLLLQLSPYSFEGEHAATIVAAIRKHESQLSALPAAAAALLSRIGGGQGKDVADRKGKRGAALARVLGDYVAHPREAALFEHPAAAKVVQGLADACARAIDAILTDSEDLYEVMDVGGPLGVLLLIEPCAIDARRIEGWRDKLRGLHARAKEEGDDPDLEAFGEYLANAEQAFALALEKLAR
jgi:hypothetical protein